MQSISVSLFTALAISSAAIAQSPSIANLVPPAADAGDTVLIEGANLAGVDSVRFSYTFQSGGRSIAWNVAASVVSATASRVEVVVPAIPSFTTLPTSTGRVSVSSSSIGASSASEPFVFLEATYGQLESIGLGSSLSTGSGRPVTTFEPANGLPFQGLVSFAQTAEIVLQNANPGASTFLLGGFPATTPVSLGDGLLAIGGPIFVLGQGTVDATGAFALNVNLPRASSLGLSFVFQHAIVDPAIAPFGVGVATGLKVSL